MKEIYYYIIIFFVLLIIELVYFRIADRFGIIDRPNERSSHTLITRRGGGIIFLCGILLWSFLFEGFLTYPWFVAGAILISIISFFDDIHSIPNRYRITIHFISIALMLYQIGVLVLHGWGLFIAIFAIIVATGIINAFNFMDGINGITGCYSLAVLLPLDLLNNRYSFTQQNLIIITIISVIVFLFFNFRKKAICFAGDVGSVTIAFVIIFLLGLLIKKTNDISYIILLAIYGVDTIMTIIHRLYLRENIFQAHRKHVFQLMANELKIPHLIVTSIYFSIQLIISLGLIYCGKYKLLYSILVIIILSTLYWAIVKKYYHLHQTKKVK